MVHRGQLDRILHLVTEGMGPYQACREANVPAKDFYKALAADPELKTEYQLARQVAEDKIEHRLHEVAMSGNLNAIKFYLNNRRADKWQDQKALQGPTTTNIQVNMGEAARQIALNPDAAALALEATKVSNLLPDNDSSPADAT